MRGRWRADWRHDRPFAAHAWTSSNECGVSDKQKLTPGGAALAIYAVNNKDEHGKNAAEIARLLRVKPSAIGQYKDMTQTDIKSRLRLLGGK